MSPPTGARANQRALRESIKRLIVERGLGPGSPLPTELELSQELEVSRHPLREAMKALEALGIVDIRHGHGTYVGSVSLGGLEDGLTFRSARSINGDLSDIRDLLEVREVLELGLVRRVLDAEIDLAELERAVRAMEAEAEKGEYAPEADWRFHETLYRPLGNELVLDLLRVFWRVFNSLDRELPRGESSPAVTAGWHREILEALRAEDEPALRAAVDEHFRGIRARVTAELGTAEEPQEPAER
ncbi:FadR/GntR family transcriptional regulator [Amycolatopsis nigrescens]|uniref:FadR/GntR family transcriptional regulator n=1 Tax=Amycolatopsis nigrescens TaxID=381445 RepID=UPI0003A3AC83|nr:FCD domain-containing protein [Amycolatopsis nigrescens]